MPNRKTSFKPNGHAGSHGRTNGNDDRRAVTGHAPASSERGGTLVPRDQAASDDARRASAAMDASCTLAPGTDCVAYAEVAPPHSRKINEKIVRAESKRPNEQRAEQDPLPPGDFPLPTQPEEFVEEIHRTANLFIAWKRQLNSKDEKIRQRAVEKLTEMFYKGAAALSDEPRRIIIDMPEPNRD